MNDLEWRETPDGYESGIYCIRRVDGSSRPRWRLELGEPLAVGRAIRARYPSVHGSVKGAKEQARRAERDRFRQARVIGHAVVGVVALVASVVLLPLMASIPGFVAAMGAVFVAIRSLTFAVSIKLGDPWEWTRDHGEPERITWSDRAVLAMMEGFRRRTSAASSVNPSSAIQALPPESDE